jgi:peptidyl-prolyl cis-trans isomerase A (cyclophilin A)
MRTIRSLAVILSALSFCSLACESSSPEKTPPPAGSTGAKRPGPSTKAEPKAQPKGPFPQSTHEAMKDPTKAVEQAPDTFDVEFDTTVGKFSMHCVRDWAPHGADRFYNLVQIDYFGDVAFFRAVKNFVVQFGIHGDPDVTAAWRKANIEPDEVKESNKKGTLTYAQAGRPAGKGMTAASRATQLFINLKDNPRLDGMGFAPVCEVTEGMDVVAKIHNGYGERAGRDQANITRKGNKYLRDKYPLLDYIKSAKIVEGGEDGAGGSDAGGAGGGDASQTETDEDGAKQSDEPKKDEKADTKTKGAGPGQGRGTAPKAKPKVDSMAAPPSPPAKKPAPATELK